MSGISELYAPPHPVLSTYESNAMRACIDHEMPPHNVGDLTHTPYTIIISTRDALFNGVIKTSGVLNFRLLLKFTESCSHKAV
jgi:hypothetical protein